MKKSSPTILSVVAAAGVVATFIFAVKETRAAEEKIEELKEENPEPSKFDIVKAAAPVYIPAAVIAGVTILCILSSNRLNKKQQASLIGAYTLLHQTHEQYKKKVKDICGEEVHDEIIDSIAVEKAKKQDIYASGIIGKYSNRMDTDYDPEDTRLFYDSYSNRYFESTIGQVKDAQYHLNRNYTLRGLATVNEYYEFLGLEPVVNGYAIGWDSSDTHEGIYWIDFESHVTNICENVGDRVDCIVIDMVFEPSWSESLWSYGQK